MFHLLCFFACQKYNQQSDLRRYIHHFVTTWWLKEFVRQFLDQSQWDVLVTSFHKGQKREKSLTVIRKSCVSKTPQMARLWGIDVLFGPGYPRSVSTCQQKPIHGQINYIHQDEAILWILKESLKTRTQLYLNKDRKFRITGRRILLIIAVSFM